MEERRLLIAVGQCVMRDLVSERRVLMGSRRHLSSSYIKGGRCSLLLRWKVGRWRGGRILRSIYRLLALRRVKPLRIMGRRRLAITATRMDICLSRRPGPHGVLMIIVLRGM